MERLIACYQQWAHEDPKDIRLLPAAGSNRRYYRLYSQGGGSVIGVIGTSREENDSFIYLSGHFRLRQLPVPEILSVSPDGMCYLQTDLGSLSLYDALAEGRKAGGRYNEEEKALLRRVISALPNFQIRGARGLDFDRCYPQAVMDKNNVLFDLNYFKYCFLKPTGLDFHELKLEASFQLMAADLLEGSDEAFMYRDFQARNIMLDQSGQPFFIDFQGGRKGPKEYDVASFLWQASAHYQPELREELIQIYLDSLKHYAEVDESEFRKRLKQFVLFRTQQVLGAYGFRGYFEQKTYFLESIPYAIANLKELLNEGACPYPYLHHLLSDLVLLPQFQKEDPPMRPRTDGLQAEEAPLLKSHINDGPATKSKYDGKGPLHVRVFSFSYRKGIPEDTSGNGGGYVFDCRSTHNPGRYEPYKKLTGLDEPVIRFLEDDGEILVFLQSVYALADAHVIRYMKRGFTDLMFSFGCTGGQHRSVYAAQHLAQHIHEKFGIEVTVCHREQNIRQVMEAWRTE